MAAAAARVLCWSWGRYFGLELGSGGRRLWKTAREKGACAPARPLGRTPASSRLAGATGLFYFIFFARQWWELFLFHWLRRVYRRLCRRFIVI